MDNDKNKPVPPARDDEDAKDHQLKTNPNPRANENVPPENKDEPPAENEVGTEITDGEDG